MVTGLAILRNGEKYDYPYMESLQSLGELCGKVHLALGEGEDNTEEKVQNLSFLEITPTQWDMSLRKGGVILSQQTNLILEKLRKSEKKPWAFYLQCDEVIGEWDYAKIHEDLKKAHEEDCDAISFRYLHFWQNHHSVAINKKWYPQEIRCVRRDSLCESWGDAQSFRKVKKIYYSDATIFHYGHVRRDDLYKLKKKDMLKLYHEDSRLGKYRRRERNYDRKTRVIDYFGPHPQVMKKRIEGMGDIFELPYKDEILLFGSKENYSQESLKKIRAHKIEFTNKWKDLFKAVWTQNIGPFGRFPDKMESSFARVWDEETQLMFRLSKNNIGMSAKI